MQEVIEQLNGIRRSLKWIEWLIAVFGVAYFGEKLGVTPTVGFVLFGIWALITSIELNFSKQWKRAEIVENQS